MNKVLDNDYLLKYICTFIPLTEEEKKLKRKVILELKHHHCEWAGYRKFCWGCEHYHPLAIRYPRYLCCCCAGLLLEHVLEQY